MKENYLSKLATEEQKAFKQGYEKGFADGQKLQVNCLIGDTVYKICPKCNPDHNGTCKNCAWQDCCLPCTRGTYIYNDGSFTKNKKQVVEKKVYEEEFVYINKLWNIDFFATREDCEKAIKEYEAICAISDNKERKAEYDKWYNSRKTSVCFERK